MLAHAFRLFKQTADIEAAAMGMLGDKTEDVEIPRESAHSSWIVPPSVGTRLHQAWFDGHCLVGVDSSSK
jgi:hypothetical protein